MPIKPENRALYPGNWKEIRAAVLLRAGDRCEFCSKPNGQTVEVGPLGQWGDEVRGEWRNAEGFPCEAPDDEVRRVKVILTIAHLDHDPGNNDPGNLRALCQRCHNRLDRKHRAETRAATRAARVRARNGPGLPFGG